MKLVTLIGLWFIATNIWALRQHARVAKEFERRFGAPPGWKYFATPTWKAGFTAPNGVTPTPEMEAYLTELNHRSWQTGVLHIWILMLIFGAWKLFN